MSSSAGGPRIALLSNSWLEGDRWGPFHQSLISILGASAGEVLVVRANSFVHPWSDTPISPLHEVRLIAALREFDPDLVFSINRAALSARVLRGLPPRTRILTLFIDFYDRVPDELKLFGERDFVWGTGIGWLRDNFIERYASVLAADQVEFTLWASDTFRFRPQNLERDLGIVYVGSPIDQRGFAELVDHVRSDRGNLRILLDVYFEHRRRYVHDIPAELERSGFDYGRVHEEPFASYVRANWILQSFMSDQVTAEARLRYLSALSEPEFDLRVYGSPERVWIDLIALADAKLLERYAFRPVEDVAELALLYNRARVGLNVQHHHAHDVGLSMRVFDILACGAVLLTHRLTNRPLAELGFEAGTHYVDFASPEEARAAARMLAQDEGTREAIGRAAAEKLRQEHSLTRRMGHVFRRAGLEETADRIEALRQSDVELVDARVSFLSDPGKVAVPAEVARLYGEGRVPRYPKQRFPRTPREVRAAIGRALPDKLIGLGIRLFRNWFLDISLKREPGRRTRR